MEKVFSKCNKYTTSKRTYITIKYAVYHLDFLVDEDKSVKELHELLDKKYLEDKKHKIAVMGGDGTGPEVVVEGLKVLQAAADKFDFTPYS